MCKECSKLGSPKQKKMHVPRIYILCPVTNAVPEVTERLGRYVLEKEAEGYEVHWPARDTPQQGDPIGYRTCHINAVALHNADEVHVFWDPTSRGSIFDLGMLFMLREIVGEACKVVLINAEWNPIVLTGKNFINIIHALTTSEEAVLEQLEELKNAS